MTHQDKIDALLSSWATLSNQLNSEVEQLSHESMKQEDCLERIYVVQSKQFALMFFGEKILQFVKEID